MGPARPERVRHKAVNNVSLSAAHSPACQTVVWRTSAQQCEAAARAVHTPTYMAVVCYIEDTASPGRCVGNRAPVLWPRCPAGEPR